MGIYQQQRRRRLCAAPPSGIGKAIDSSTTPPFGVEMYGYVGTVGANGTKVRTEADESADVLIPLTAGTRISIIGVVNGWAYLAYYRQYGYVNTNELSELLPYARRTMQARTKRPLLPSLPIM